MFMCACVCGEERFAVVNGEGKQVLNNILLMGNNARTRFCICVCVYIYVYIYTCVCVCVCVCVYVYIGVCVVGDDAQLSAVLRRNSNENIYIYTYIHTYRRLSRWRRGAIFRGAPSKRDKKTCNTCRGPRRLRRKMFRKHYRRCEGR